jgi:2-keto-3-deoxy-L-rhamnonate aldolase RhmA
VDTFPSGGTAWRGGEHAGRASGILAADGKAEPYLDQGATMVGVGTDLHLLIAAADGLAARFKPSTR